MALQAFAGAPRPLAVAQQSLAIARDPSAAA